MHLPRGIRKGDYHDKGGHGVDNATVVRKYQGRPDNDDHDLEDFVENIVGNMKKVAGTFPGPENPDTLQSPRGSSLSPFHPQDGYSQVVIG